MMEEESPLKEFYSFLNKSFILIEPGVNPRKWIHNSNRDLSKLITEYIDDESEWLTHLQLLRPILSQINQISDDSFYGKFIKIRLMNKHKLVNHLKLVRKEPNFLHKFDFSKTIFEGSLRKITKTARTLLIVFYAVKKYTYLKTLSKKQK